MTGVGARDKGRRPWLASRAPAKTFEYGTNNASYPKPGSQPSPQSAAEQPDDGKGRAGAGARHRLSLAQQTLLLSFKRSSFQSHLDSHLQTPPLLSINHPRLNGRFMQILILGTERRSLLSTSDHPFPPREPLFPSLYIFPCFFMSLAFSTSSSTLGFFTAASCPFLLLSLLYILLSLLYLYVFLIKLRWRSQWYIFSKGKAKSLIIFTFNILSLSLSLWKAFNYFLNTHLFSLNIRKIHHRFISLQQFVGCVDSKIWSSERELYNEIAIQRGFWWKEMVAKRWWRGE